MPTRSLSLLIEALHRWEQQHIPNGGGIGKQHTHTVNTEPDASCRRHPDHKRIEERYKRRQELERLEMDVILAQSELLNIMCIAITGGRTNGNVEVAQVKLTQATDAYQGFIRDEASKAAAKE